MTQPSRSLVVLMTGALVAVGTPVLAAPPEPSSAKDLAESRQTVREKEQKIEQTTARLKQERAELAKLGDRVEQTRKRYDEEAAELERTRKALAEARQQMRMADAKYETAQANAAQVETAQAGAAQAGNVHADDAQAGNVHADDAQAGNVHVEELQGEDAHAEETQAEDGERAETAGSPQEVQSAENTGTEDAESVRSGAAPFVVGLVPSTLRKRAVQMEQLEMERTHFLALRAEAHSAYERQHQAVTAALSDKKEAEEAYEAQKEKVSRLLALKKRLVAELGRAENKVIFLADRRRKGMRSANPATEPQVVVSKGKKRQFARGAARGRRVVQSALKWIGTPYSWGGGNPSGPSYGIGRGARTRGFDCSGLALYAWAQAGVKLDHFTGSQWNSGPRIPLSMLSPGDLVFFARSTKNPDTIHHVGIFIGRGRMVEAPYTGARVRVSSIWRKGLIGAVRPA